MSRSKTIRRWTFWICAAAVVVLSANWLHTFVPPKPRGVIGALFADLGVHMVHHEPVTVAHTFTLANDTGHQLSIKKIVTTCGCTEARASHEVIPASATFEVSAAMALKSSGRRQALITLILDECEPITLELIATGRTLAQSYVVDRTLNLRAGSAQHVVVAQVGDPSNAPAELAVQAPGGVTAAPGPWELVSAGDPQRQILARWHCAVAVIAGPEFSSQTGPLAVGFPDGKWDYVGLHGRPWY